MRVALVSDRFDPAGGGLEQWLHELARQLEHRGHEVHVLAFRVAAGAGGPRVHALPWSPRRLARAAAIERAVAAIAPDVTHDTGVGWSCDILQPQAGSLLANHRRDLASLPAGLRFWRRVGPGGHRWRREALELEQRQYVRAPGLVIAVSRAIARDLQARYGVPAERLRLVPNGVDPDRFAPARCAVLRPAARARLGADASTAVFAFVARNPRLKGLLPLLRAVARLRDNGPPLKLVAVGCEPDARLRREILRLRLGDVVTFAGVVVDPESYYAAADAFVLPTYHDACSLTVLEACACGLPVVTTRYNGAAELIAHDRDGFVLGEPDDVTGLAALMSRAIAADVRGRMSLAARELALRNTLARNVAAVEHVYHEVLARRGTRR